MDSEDNLKFKKIIEDVEELGIEYDLDDNLIKNIIVEIKNNRKKISKPNIRELKPYIDEEI